MYVAEAAPFAIPKPGLAGAHQTQNAIVAAVAGHLLGLPQEAICRGVAQARWSARLQRLTQGPLLVHGCELWLDGGHNAHAAAALRDWLQADATPTALVIGMMQRKDMQAFFRELSLWSGPVVTVMVEALGAATATQLAQIAKSAGMQNVTPAENLQNAMGLADKAGVRRVLICGSLYLAGQVLKTHS
jgi:dihydrofolate synthase/folylpolyglutamate synthase